MEKKGGRTGPAPLPIWRDANRLLLEIERAVQSFPRYHKYTIGSDLRMLAMRLCRCLARALAATDGQRLRYVQHMLDTLGDLKIAIQLAKELQAFAGFAIVERVAHLAVSIGKQGGAWRRRLSSTSARPASRA